MQDNKYDLSEYFTALEKFKEDNVEEVIKNWESVEAFEHLVKKMKEMETEIAIEAINQYGSIEKYTKAMKENLSNFSENMDKINAIKNKSNEYMDKNKYLLEKLVQDISKDVKSKEIQDIIQKLVQLSDEVNAGMDMGEHFWDMVIEGFFTNQEIVEFNDKEYGPGASHFIGRAYQQYFKK